LTDLATLTGIAVSVSAVVVALVAIVVQWKYQKKQYQFSALGEVHKILTDRNARNSRAVTFKLYQTYLKSKDLAVFDVLETDHVGPVMGDLDIVGSMVNQGFVPKDAFLSVYCGLVIRTWKALKDNIEAGRRNRNDSRYMTYFEQLNTLAEGYWRNHYPNQPIPEPY
jgi:nitrogen fixation-related uncharacterized protein